METMTDICHVCNEEATRLQRTPEDKVYCLQHDRQNLIALLKEGANLIDTLAHGDTEAECWIGRVAKALGCSIPESIPTARCCVCGETFELDTDTYPPEELHDDGQWTCSGECLLKGTGRA